MRRSEWKGWDGYGRNGQAIIALKIKLEKKKNVHDLKNGLLVKVIEMQQEPR